MEAQIWIGGEGWAEHLPDCSGWRPSGPHPVPGAQSFSWSRLLWLQGLECLIPAGSIKTRAFTDLWTMRRLQAQLDSEAETMSLDGSLCFLRLCSALACLRCPMVPNWGQQHMPCLPRIKPKRKETSFL